MSSSLSTGSISTGSISSGSISTTYGAYGGEYIGESGLSSEP
jgi:hypothetical protein